jgi:hypothetical protein
MCEYLFQGHCNHERTELIAEKKLSQTAPMGNEPFCPQIFKFSKYNCPLKIKE